MPDTSDQSPGFDRDRWAQFSATSWTNLMMARQGSPEQSEAALEKLRKGVKLKDFVTLPAEVKCIDEPEGLWPRNPPVRIRLSIPTSWLQLTIREGKNRQVRRMTAAVGLPTLRLIRYRIGEWTLDGLAPSNWREIQVDSSVFSKSGWLSAYAEKR